MSHDIAALEAQHAQLTADLAAAKTSAKAGAIAKVKSLMTEHGLVSADVAGNLTAVKRVGKPTGKVAPKYLGPAGFTWAGRGLQPNWLKAELASGHSIDEFKIAA